MCKEIIPIILIMTICSCFVPTACGVSYNIQEFIISDTSFDTMNLYADGDYVVFRDSMYMQLYGYQLSQQYLFEIPSNSYFTFWTKKHTHVIWLSDYGLHGYDLEGREAFTISTEPMIDTMTTALSNRYVFWLDPSGNGLVGFDLEARQGFVVDLTQTMSPNSVKASGNYCVWYDSMTESLRAYDVPVAETLEIFMGQIDIYNIIMNDAYVAWTDMNGILHGYDLSGRESFQIASEGVDPFSLKLAGEFILWYDWNQMELLGYNLSMRESFVVSESDTIDVWTMIVSSKYAVWSEMTAMGTRLNGYNLATRQALPLNINYGIYYPPAITSDYLIWVDYDMETSTYSIQGFDVLDWQPFLVAELSSMGPMFAPLVTEEGYVIWGEYDEAGMTDILMGGQMFEVLNDTCADAVELLDETPYLGDTIGSTGTDLTGCGFLDELDVWHQYTPTVGGEVTITTDGSTFDTTLAVFNACGGIELACNDDYSLEHTNSKVELTAVKGKTYLIRVAGFNNQTGDYKVLISRGICVSPLISDLNNDCKVNIADLSILASEWLQCGLEPSSACTE